MATKKPKKWTTKRINSLALAVAHAGEGELSTYLSCVAHKLVELATNAPEVGVDRAAEYVFAHIKYVDARRWDIDLEIEFNELRKIVRNHMLSAAGVKV